NYYYDWIRDSALAYESLVSRYWEMTPEQKHGMFHQMEQYRLFTQYIQKTKTIAGLGEPKFNMDGTAFNGEWTRPQNDGPALRAIAMIHWANILIQKDNLYMAKYFYSNEWPGNAPAKRDLEYIARHWQDSTYDLWEEVKGSHFYTLM